MCSTICLVWMRLDRHIASKRWRWPTKCVYSPARPLKVRMQGFVTERDILHGPCLTGKRKYRYVRRLHANSCSLVGFSFMVAPLVSEPPDWILPDPVRYAGWYGEIWVRYPLHNHLVPSYFANNFYSRSLFRIIMNRASQAAYSDFPETSLENAYELLSQLKGWFDGLSGPLLPKSIVLPAHLQLQ